MQVLNGNGRTTQIGLNRFVSDRRLRTETGPKRAGKHGGQAEHMAAHVASPPGLATPRMMKET